MHNRTHAQKFYTAARHHRQKGFGLVELGIALVIMGAIVAGVLAMMNSTSLSQKAGQLRTDLVSLKAAVNHLGYQAGNYGTASLNALLISSGKMPTTLRTQGAATINHQFDGTVTVTGANTRFHVALTNVPKDACISLVSGDMGWDWVGTAVPTAAQMITPGVANKPPLAPNRVEALCAANTQTLYFAGR